MKIKDKALTASEIRELNIERNDILGYDFQYENGVDNNYLTVNGERILSFTNSRDRRRTKDKIQKQNVGLGWNKPQLTDEEQGIIQASNNGENPFAYTIMCGDPRQNKIVK